MKGVAISLWEREGQSAGSECFIQMQRIHHSKHRADVAAVLAHVSRIVAETQASMLAAGESGQTVQFNSQPFADDMAGLVELVCKNVRELAFVCSSSLEQSFPTRESMRTAKSSRARKFLQQQ